ncbi:hypothetical protein I302_105324 [Kwoniella bestiolae CBS 10118]|uniref:Uncharacterized protein n=1 Tax=Kwoniella bestiolae CBS 10118 TaxID=1296100 RepID=A0A1B9FST1_9TREE|nr:hypothetical protein I302_08610 [Kwoniella bestiolae CBS 10118]OCF21831.1 hypothetical protein I302_08610 [Kwoniella bestiolae CBS 10118]
MRWPFQKRMLLKDWPQFSIIDTPGSIKLYCVVPTSDQGAYDRIFKFADNPRIYGFAHYHFRGYIYAIFGKDEYFTRDELDYLIVGLQRWVGPRERVHYAMYYCTD